LIINPRNLVEVPRAVYAMFMALRAPPAGGAVVVKPRLFLHDILTRAAQREVSGAAAMIDRSPQGRAQSGRREQCRTKKNGLVLLWP
jgi:hypothetical protein